MDDGIIVKKLYGGKIEVKFYGPTEDKPNRHMYYVDRKRKGSVTGALAIIDKSRALIPWAVDMYSDYLMERLGQKITKEMIYEGEEEWQKKKTAAANIGTTAHDWIDLYVKGEEPDMPEDQNVAQAINGFLKWVDEYDVKFIDAEKVVYSKKYKYIGTLDAIAKFGNGRKKYLVDYKVSNGLYPTVAYQTAGYLKADEEESGAKYDGRWAIRLSKETEEEYMERQEKKLSKWMRKNPTKTAYEISPYVPFEARLLDDGVMNIDRDFKIFLSALSLSVGHKEVDDEFFRKSKD